MNATQTETENVMVTLKGTGTGTAIESGTTSANLSPNLSPSVTGKSATSRTMTKKTDFLSNVTRWSCCVTSGVLEK